MNPNRTVTLLPLLFLACAGAEREATFEAPSDTLLSVGGTELFVHQEGSGPPLVVVHGGPVLDHGYLVAPLAPLADSRRLVFFDQRLSGRSAGAVDSASVRLDTLVSDIEALRKELGLDRIDLLGHSWGGLLAARYALLHPDRLRSLILVSPMAPSAELWREEEALLRSYLSPEDTAGMGELAASPDFQDGDPAAAPIESSEPLRTAANGGGVALPSSLPVPIDVELSLRGRAVDPPRIPWFELHSSS